MNKCIDNIIFDLGGVLFDIDYDKTFKELGTILDIKLEIDKWPSEFIKLVHAFEIGSINTETFLWNLQRMNTLKVPLPHKLISAWNAMLIGLHNGVLEMLSNLGKHYNIYLLSNNNELHYQYFINSFKKPNGIDDFFSLFQGVCFSHLIGYKKPDLKAFEFILAQYDLDFSKTLFIDDDEVNTIAANKAGIYTAHHHRNNSITCEIFSYLELVC